MNTIEKNEYKLSNIDKINIVLGKNGCGKSTLLRSIDAGITGSQDEFGKSRYITPERGGALRYAAGIEENIARESNWISGQRRRNQAENFRQQSVAQYRTLESLILRGIDKDRTLPSFSVYIDKINSLLDNIEIRAGGATFQIFRKGSNQELKAEDISSGESELISLGIECLIFGEERIAGKENILFLDEPDVHLHPDLQVRFVHFLRDLVFERGFQVVIATHSTAILGALESYESSRLALMVSGQKELIFHEISETYRKILPVFGAHPLSNFFNLAPVLLVEGNDDERIWQQAVRSSEGRIKVYPCSVEGVEKLIEFENEANSIIQAVYNDAKGYSLRDRDDTDGAIENIGAIIRMKLLCRNAENLILSNEVLETLGISWADVPQKINDWLDKNQGHAHFEVMKGFLESGFQRKTYDIKEIRNDLMALFGSSKQWEVVVGQSIATIVRKESMSYEIDGSLSSYLGEAVVNNLILSE